MGKPGQVSTAFIFLFKRVSLQTCLVDGTLVILENETTAPSAVLSPQKQKYSLKSYGYNICTNCTPNTYSHEY